MAKGGKKYRLLMYEFILNRWWPTTLLLAFSLFLFVGILWFSEYYSANTGNNPYPTLSTTDQVGMLAVGGISLLVTFYFLVTRKMAYVQLFDDHLRLVTPYLRLNISYNRFQNTVTTQMFNVFPPRTLSRRKLDMLEPVLGKMVAIIQLSKYPISRQTLNLFLSPFFFYDNSPHFVLMIDDWMQFSSELDSRRILFKSPRRTPPPPAAKRSSGLLDDLMRK